MWKGCIAAASIAAVVVLSGCSSGSSSDPAATKTDAERVCKEWVKDKLKAPSTAKFSDVHSHAWGDETDRANAVEAGVEMPSDIPSTVTGYVVSVTGSVDSQNSFGAMLRTTWTCAAALNGDNWSGHAKLAGE